MPVSLYVRVFIKRESSHSYFKLQNDFALFHSWMKDHTRDRFFRNSILQGPYLKEQKALQHVIHKTGQKKS